ncbi:hypothetical protein PQQ64_29230 [Paraburkholderia graminis]|uniref:hypothetical protein n=1 Tax=Paraburkholderia graminis TaxID=60548 RepID=UPI0038B84857
MSKAKTQMLRNAPASIKRSKGPASNTAKIDESSGNLFNDDLPSHETPTAKRSRAEPAVKKSAVARAQQTTKAAPKRAALIGSVRINFDLEKAVHKRLKMLAVEGDMTIADWMRALIQKELERIDKRAR